MARPGLAADDSGHERPGGGAPLGAVLPGGGQLPLTGHQAVPPLGLRPAHLRPGDRLVARLQHLPPPAAGLLHVRALRHQPRPHRPHGHQLRHYRGGGLRGVQRLLRPAAPLPHVQGSAGAQLLRLLRPGVPHLLLRLRDGGLLRPRPLRALHDAAHPDRLRQRPQDEEGQALHHLADRPVLFPHGGHLAQQRHQGLPGQHAHQREEVLPPRQPHLRHHPARRPAVAGGPRRMATLRVSALPRPPGGQGEESESGERGRLPNGERHHTRHELLRHRPSREAGNAGASLGEIPAQAEAALRGPCRQAHGQGGVQPVDRHDHRPLGIAGGERLRGVHTAAHRPPPGRHPDRTARVREI